MPVTGVPVAGVPDRDAALLAAAAQSFSDKNIVKIGVAVSGGSDSLAALHLIVQAAASRGCQVHGVTVDHRLRPEAAAEADYVGQICAGLGVSHTVLVWPHGDIAGNLMDAARRARYDLMAQWAMGLGIGHIVLGHTADDQAETFLMGLARAAGVDGLSGMRESWVLNSVRFDRPFLHISRADLRAYLLRRGVNWVNDPSNENSAYARIKARRVLAALQPLGISLAHLGRVVTNLNVARAALHSATNLAARQIVTETAGGLTLDLHDLKQQPFDIQRRLWLAALAWISGSDYPPRAAALRRAEQAVSGGNDTTLAGCKMSVAALQLCITREPRAVADLVCATDQLWDGRWRLIGQSAPGQHLRALGAHGLRRCTQWRETGLSRDILLVTPAVWHGDALIAAPIAGYAQGWSAQIVPSFHDHILSH